MLSFDSSHKYNYSISTNRQMSAYICNFGEHWFAIRKMGRQWFNLNSLLTGPELLSDTYLRLFLTQLQQDGELTLNPIALRKAKIVWNFGLSECNGVKVPHKKVDDEIYVCKI